MMSERRAGRREPLQKPPVAQSVSRTVDFGYDPSRLILRGVNLDIQPGERDSIRRRHRRGQEHAALARAAVLRSHCRPGFPRWSVISARLTKKSLRSQISLVLQDTLLFSTTVRENT